MTARVRWTCDGGHPGVLAPARLRRVDLRRYCLECSKAAGVLVERVAPARQARSEARAAVKAKRRARKVRTAKQREAAKRAARLANYARYCGPAVVARALGITRERAAELLAAVMGSDRYNRGTPSFAVRRVFGAGPWQGPGEPLPTLAQWRKAHPGATAIVQVTGHYVYLSHGRLIEHNGRKSSRARVRAWLDLSTPSEGTQ